METVRAASAAVISRMGEGWMKRNLQWVAVAASLLVASLSWGQAPTGLQPPAGHKMAIVVFEDLECPSCRSAEPVLKDAEKNYGIPLVRHDFPIPSHRWSAQAHLIARYFDTQSPQLGEEYRHWVFMNQGSINKSNVLEKSNEFAKAHNTGLPFALDPSGQLQAKIEQDKQLGNTLHVNQTPTIFVVGDVKTQPVVELNNIADLGPTIENMKQRVTAEASSQTAKPAAKSARKSSAKKGSSK